MGDRDKDKCTVVHQGVHSLHVVQVEDVKSGARAWPRHVPHYIQPGLRPFPQVGDLGREGQALVDPQPDSLDA